ncbi:CopY family transcriptional regulator [Enemella dayhoffiae]|uniref:CopY family transcriptional regulator n=1 Tax=Enemella dayhoffiae TaxID=2016507 RepID=A0A255HBU7_9ACTN|nr:BlaI/MecI/CopY family transcriptional regulator [Enemella dayhoffiae]OYO25105.1 CopY family transcriptional regulator [Enemella dayhoffiae]
MALLGELETKVMEALWHAPEPRSVRQVHTVLVGERDLAYTTVMTVLDRLAKKQIVRRQRDGRQWLYQPNASRSVLIAEEVLELVTGTEEERREILTQIVAHLAPADRASLTEAIELIERPHAG